MDSVDRADVFECQRAAAGHQHEDAQSQDAFHTKYIIDDQFMSHLESLPVPEATLNVCTFEDKAVLKNFLKKYLRGKPEDRKFNIDSVWLHAVPISEESGQDFRLYLQSLDDNRREFQVEDRERVFAEVVRSFFEKGGPFVVKPTRGRKSEGVVMIEPDESSDRWTYFKMNYEHGIAPFTPNVGTPEEVVKNLVTIFMEEWSRMDKPQSGPWVDPEYPGFIIEPRVIFEREVPLLRHGGPSPIPELRIMWASGVPIVATFKLTSKSHVVWRADMSTSIENISRDVQERLDITSADEIADLIASIEEVVAYVKRLSLAVNMIAAEINERDPRRLVRTDFLVSRVRGSKMRFLLNEIQTNGDFNPIIHPYFEFYVDENKLEWRNRMQDGSFVEGEQGAKVRKLILQYFRKGLRRPRRTDVCNPKQLLRYGWYE